MKNILVVFDPSLDEVECPLLLARLKLPFVQVSLDDVIVDEALFVDFALVIIETGGGDTKAYDLLLDLNQFAGLSGLKRPVAIVVAAGGAAISEQIARKRKTDFFFVRPIDQKSIDTVVHRVLSSKDLYHPGENKNKKG